MTFLSDELSLEDRKADDTETDDELTFTDDIMDDQQQTFPNIDELDESSMPILGANSRMLKQF